MNAVRMSYCERRVRWVDKWLNELLLYTQVDREGQGGLIELL